MQPLKTNNLQTALRRVRELPGLRVSVGTDRDSARRNAFTVTLDVSFEAISTNLRITNRGTRDVGRTFFIGQTAANGLFGRDLKIGAVVGLAETPREFRGAGLFIDTPLKASDRRANLLAFRSLSDPTEKTGDAGVDYIHNRISWTVGNPWRRIGAMELKSSGGIELDDQYIKLLGAEVQADRERIVSANTQMLWSPSPNAQSVASWGIRVGVDAAGAGLDSLLAVEPGRDEDFVVGTLQIIQLTRFAGVWQIRFDVLGQYSNDVLADRERFKIGGDHLGRGFEVPAISGDRGAGAKAELRRDLPALNFAAGNVSTYAYYDFGAAWRNPRGARESAASAGVGLSLQGKWALASVEFARPLTRADVDGFKHNTVFGELSVSF
jgi:hemolysin activation/secretion protein